MKKEMKALEKLIQKGDYSEALKFWLEVLNREDRLDIEHLNFIDMGIEISVPLYAKRHLDAALDCVRTVYEKRRQIMGPKHLDTLNALRKVIRVRFEKGEVEEAFDMCNNLDDCITLERTLATELFNRGEYERALHFFQRAYEEAVESLGAEDAETLSLRLLVARVLSTLGRHRESMEVSKEVAEKREKNLGATHSFTLIAWQTVAVSLFQLNEGDECLSVLNKIYQKAVRVLGPDHPDSQEIQKRIADALAGLGRNVEAVRVYQDILEHQDPDKPEFLATKNVILDLLLKLGKPDEARHVYNMVYEILIRKHSKDHDILEERIKIAENYAKEGKFKEAADQYRQIYNVRKEVFGSEDSKTLYSQYEITEMLLKAGECREAFSIVSDLLEKRGRTLGLESEDTLQTMMLKARILAKLEKFHDSISVMEHIISVRDRLMVTSDNVSDFVIALTNAGSICCLIGDYNRALHNFSKACRLRARYPRYTNVMGSDKDIVLSLWNSGKAVEIIDRFQEFRHLCYDSPNRNYRVILNIQIILGEFLFLVGSFEESLDCFKSAHEILTTFFSVEDSLPAVLQTKIYMGKILFLQSKLDDALKVLKNAYSQIVLILGQDHPESKEAEQNLVECLRAKKEEADSGANVIGAEGGSSHSGSGVKESVEGEESVEMKDVSAAETKSVKRRAGTSKGQRSKIRSPSKPLPRSPTAAEYIISKKLEGMIIDSLGESKSGMECKDAENNLVQRLKAKAASEIDSEANVISAEGGSQSGSEGKESVESEESVEMKDVSVAETKSVEMKDVSAAETKSVKRGAGTSKGQRSKIRSPSKPSLPRSPTATGNIIEKKLEEIILDALGESKSEK